MSDYSDLTDHPDLAALLRGELTNAAAAEAAAHARGCETCRAELVDDALGHGLLSRARRTLPDLDADGQLPTTTLPPALRRELARPRRRLAVWAGAAAAVVLVAGTGLAFGVHALTHSDSPASAVPQQSAPLEPVEGSASGRVSMGTDHQVTRMRLATRSLPRAAGGEYYYAWLFDPRTKKMLPLGQVTPGRTAVFEIPESLVEAYSAVDVSLEADDGDPAHSVTSVLRATYAAPQEHHS